MDSEGLIPTEEYAARKECRKNNRAREEDALLINEVLNCVDPIDRQLLNRKNLTKKQIEELLAKKAYNGNGIRVKIVGNNGKQREFPIYWSDLVDDSYRFSFGSKGRGCKRGIDYLVSLDADYVDRIMFEFVKPGMIDVMFTLRDSNCVVTLGSPDTKLCLPMTDATSNAAKKSVIALMLALKRKGMIKDMRTLLGQKLWETRTDKCWVPISGNIVLDTNNTYDLYHYRFVNGQPMNLYIRGTNERRKKKLFKFDISVEWLG